jgi:hypothetical protein
MRQKEMINKFIFDSIENADFTKNLKKYFKKKYKILDCATTVNRM